MSSARAVPYLYGIRESQRSPGTCHCTVQQAGTVAQLSERARIVFDLVVTLIRISVSTAFLHKTIVDHIHIYTFTVDCAELTTDSELASEVKFSTPRGQIEDCTVTVIRINSRSI